MRITRLPRLVVFALAALPSYAAAQPAWDIVTAAPRYGWTFTPTLTAGPQWDDNVLVQGNDDAPASDIGSVVSPIASIDFIGRKSEFSVGYTGNFALYRNFPALNSFEQAQRLAVKRRVTRRVTLSAFEAFTMSPTTELQQLVGVPFVRIGSRVANGGASLDITLSRKTTILATYNAQWLRFNDDDLLQGVLVGGESHGGRVGIRHTLSRRIALTTDAEATRATIASGGAFAVQNATFGGEYRLDALTRLFGSAGAARLVAPDIVTPRILPAWRAGVVRTFNPFGVEASYGRTFVPSYAGGGTEANDEVTFRVSAPIGRRGYFNASTAWRKGSVLVVNDLPLNSVWTSATLGYALRPWMRVEGFYAGQSQRIDRPGGAVDRRRIGLLISTGAPMRIR